jgi:hypothetical protein
MLFVVWLAQYRQIPLFANYLSDISPIFIPIYRKYSQIDVKKL